MKGHKFRSEFQVGAVKLVVGVSGATGPRPCVHENVLRKWVKEFGANPAQAFSRSSLDEARAAGDRTATP